jgi:hypothetical protein
MVLFFWGGGGREKLRQYYESAMASFPSGANISCVIHHDPFPKKINIQCVTHTQYKYLLQRKDEAQIRRKQYG